MNMTSIFVELVVIGIGASTALVLAFLSFLGWDWVPWTTLTSLPMAVPALSVVYVLGIVTDRIADHLFHPLGSKLRKKFFSSGAAYSAAKNKVYESASRRELQEYGKSRLRICRAWVLIWAALAVLIPLFISRNAVYLGDTTRVSLISFALCALLAQACFFSWKSITTSNYRQLAGE